MTNMDPSGSGPAERLLRLGERLLSLLVEAGRTRAELVAVEFAVEKLRLVQFLAMGIVFAVCALLGLAFGSMLIIACFWDTHRLAAIAVVALVYAVIALVMAIIMMRRLNGDPPPFVHSLDTFRRDYAAMQERLRRAKSQSDTPGDVISDDFPGSSQPPLPRDSL
jgi:uncharacterized membrane protein YqjE